MERNILRSLSGAFFGTFGVVATAISGFDIKRWMYLFVSFVVGILAVMVTAVDLYKTKKKFQGFFNIKDHDNLNLAVGSYYDTRSYNEKLGEEENYRYYKFDSEKNKRYLVGSIEHPLTDVGVAEQAAKFACYISTMGKYDLKLYGDESLPHSFSGPVICLGSPTSNRISGMIVDRLPDTLKVNFTTKVLSIPEGLEYTSNNGVDYGVLIRRTINERTYFVCAGIDEHGTIAVSKMLMRNWRNLPSGDFIKAYKVNKERRDIDGEIFDKPIPA